jgi:hypothetical protein
MAVVSAAETAAKVGGAESFLLGLPQTTRTLVICITFIALSTWCTLYNKFIFEHVYESSNCLLLVQNIVALAAMAGLQRSGRVCVQYRLDRFDIVCGACYSLNVMTGLWSLVFVNIAMFGVLKRCTVIASWTIELLFTPTASTKQTIVPIAVMIIGTVVAGANDLTYHAVGYLLSLTSCCFQSTAFELGRRVAEDKKGVAQVLYANSVVAIAIQIVVVGLTGEYSQLAPSVLTGEVLFHFIVNSLSCLAMNYVIFLNCLVNSPLAHAVTGNLKAAAATLIGVVIFGASLKAIGWVGVLGNFVGAGWFSYVKYQARAPKVPMTHNDEQTRRVDVQCDK